MTAADWQLDFAWNAENLPRLAALRREMLRCPEPERDLAWRKSMSRLDDARRIAAGEATAEEIQAENSVFPAGAKWHFEDLLRDQDQLRPEQWQRIYDTLLSEGPQPPR